MADPQLGKVLVNLTGETPQTEDTLAQHATEAAAAFQKLQQMHREMQERRPMRAADYYGALDDAGLGRLADLAALGRAGVTGLTSLLYGPHSMAGKGAAQIRKGAQELATLPDVPATPPPSSFPQKEPATPSAGVARYNLQNQAAQGVSDIVRGAMPFGAPMMAPALASAPLATLAGLPLAMGAQAGVEALGERAGAAPGVRALMGDFAGAVVGGAVSEFAPEFGEGLTQAATQARDLINRLDRSGNPEAGALKIEFKTRDVKARSIEDLDRRIPQEVRVVSPDATKTIDGRQFHDLDLDAPGEGFLPLRKLGEEEAQRRVERAFDEAVSESEIGGGTAARDAVKKTKARPPKASFFDQAFSLAKRARYWYELSAEAFTGKYFNVPRQLQPRVIDATAGTSGGVEPGPNQQRAIGILSEDMQGVPIMTDLRDPVSARNALVRVEQGLRSLKYRSFGGTMKFLAGLSKERPLTTNDVQVASMFGIKGEDIGKNPVLYEVLSRFFIKLRDMQNEHLLPGEQPWETWQMQAPAWVHERALKNPAKAAEYDDYSLVLPKLIERLQAAGVPTPGGKITVETLLDPRTPFIMSSTRERFMGAPVATIEVGSKLTPEGVAADELYNQIRSLDPTIPWVREALDKHEQIQRNTMSAIAKRKGANKKLGIEAEPSLISKYVSAITGKTVDISRIDRMGYGVFEGELSPNFRVPVTGRTGEEWVTLNDVEHEALLAMLGQDLNQKAMASSRFQFLPENHPAPDTHSVFLRRYDGVLDKKAIAEFSNRLGHSVNVSQLANGVLIDINMEFPEGRPRYGPAKDAVTSAAKAIFGRDPGIEEIRAFQRSYDSKYVTQEEYEEKIDAWRKAAQRSPAGGAVGKPGGRGRAGAGPGRTGDLARTRQKVRSHARVRDKKFADWTETNRAKLAQHLEKERVRTASPVGPWFKRTWFYSSRE